ncbi:unnamed protein product [Acanthoscelides obtectus]|uniref:Uncharacterized protein n=1 Tax=Acanthoscelides obtectus TaxID=200917 RepID=A0A9P0LHU9_ACAOB|nr:unnamed protein product [Acanthoscelides obtectus]CAK1681779.1 hypothetical protein AOBTE_LOCUS33268 [Acanthoscelides obtectus]
MFGMFFVISEFYFRSTKKLISKFSDTQKLEAIHDVKSAIISELSQLSRSYKNVGSIVWDPHNMFCGCAAGRVELS